jgi:hypothetical protein
MEGTSGRLRQSGYCWMVLWISYWQISRDAVSTFHCLSVVRYAKLRTVRGKRPLVFFRINLCFVPAQLRLVSKTSTNPELKIPVLWKTQADACASWGLFCLTLQIAP